MVEKVEKESHVVWGNIASSLEAGDRICIGHDFETIVDGVDDGEGGVFRIKGCWKDESACK